MGSLSTASLGVCIVLCNRLLFVVKPFQGIGFKTGGLRFGVHARGFVSVVIPRGRPAALDETLSLIFWQPGHPNRINRQSRNIATKVARSLERAPGNSKFRILWFMCCFGPLPKPQTFKALNPKPLNPKPLNPKALKP